MPPGLPTFGFMRSGRKDACLPHSSRSGFCRSYRSPTSRVSLRLTFHVSCTKKPHDERRYCGADSFPIEALSKYPSRKLAKPLPMLVPPGRLVVPKSGWAVWLFEKFNAGAKPVLEMFEKVSIFHSPPALNV